LLIDALVGMLALRTVHHWALMTSRPWLWLGASWVVLLVVTVLSTGESLLGYFAGTLLMIVPLAMILLRPFGIETLFVTRLHRKARLQAGENPWGTVG
jgi:hypothetical protein